MEIDDLISDLIATYGRDSVRTRQLADDIYQRSLATGHRRGEAIGLRYIGNDNRLKAHYDIAESQLLEAAAIAREHCSDEDHAFVLLGLASLYTDIKNTEKSISVLQQSADLFSRSGRHDGEARSLLMLANLHMVNEDPVPAIEASRQALVLYSNLQDERGIANSFANLGNAYGLKQDYARAQEYLFLALKYFTEMKQPYNMAALNSNLAEIYTKLEDYRGALAHSDSALSAIDGFDFPYLVAAIRLNKYEAYFRSGRTEEATRELEAVYEIGRERNAPQILEQARKQEALVSGKPQHV